ncbi:flagellar motor protein MotB [Clostridium saccharoperbutylacetonicum]|uniref:flagellar motor protein MotB n=1 Tax=Clostridium saccharoperbutylacetonicum TaxID=36745 RepID=UPI000983D57C|nr:flagellar motor protein MotB [Clostridium saccharoperbutylacetonicum]AQR97902.1 motility protein B [Clostridium saccharoperbutylacetonicum]NSB33794.1 chemotaxis protein MotB [Clostridium saccharoperbutylacetonicum]
MSKKKQHHEEHVDEAWLLPYSDMLTLLLALFIVMFAMGKTDSAKLKAMSKSFNIIFAGGQGVMQSDGNSMIPMENTSEGSGKSDAEVEQDKMTEIKKMIEQEIGKEGYADKIKVELNGDGLDITIQDVVLFNSGQADVHQNVAPLMSKISSMLHGLDNQIKVVGHTDNVPISNSRYRSNWELSAERAVNVRELMVSGSYGLNPQKVSIQAWADLKPKAANDTEDGRAQNRRVEILVARQYTTTDNKSD